MSNRRPRRMMWPSGSYHRLLSAVVDLHATLERYQRGRVIPRMEIVWNYARFAGKCRQLLRDPRSSAWLAPRSRIMLDRGHLLQIMGALRDLTKVSGSWAVERAAEQVREADKSARYALRDALSRKARVYAGKGAA